MITKCPKCDSKLEKDARFCSRCGYQIPEKKIIYDSEEKITESNMKRNCSVCGREIPLDARICPYCGKNFGENTMASEKKHTGFGIAALVLGIIAMCLIWITIFPWWLRTSYYFVHLPLGILAIIFGTIGYWGGKRHDTYGLAGFILGLVVTIVGFIFMFISSVMWGRYY